MLERLGKYEILETVAAGGQGTVYRARDGQSGDVVALKVMHAGHTGEVQYLEALRQEANLASSWPPVRIRWGEPTSYHCWQYLSAVLLPVILPKVFLRRDPAVQQFPDLQSDRPGCRRVAQVKGRTVTAAQVP